MDRGEIAGDQDAKLIHLHKALKELEEVDDREAEIVKLRFFAGLTNREISEMIPMSTATVERDWRFARVWSHRRMAVVASPHGIGARRESV